MILLLFVFREKTLSCAGKVKRIKTSYQKNLSLFINGLKEMKQTGFDSLKLKSIKMVGGHAGPQEYD